MTIDTLNEANEILDQLDRLKGSLESAVKGSQITIGQDGFMVGGWRLCKDEGLAVAIRQIVINNLENAIKEKERKLEAL